MSEPANSETVTIRALGARGDGIAEDGTLVPYTLPGERAEIRREARRGVLLGVAQASPDRVEPFCPYYMRCGGCRTQHLARPAELAWKRDLVAQACPRRASTSRQARPSTPTGRAAAASPCTCGRSAAGPRPG